jgi:hypothetical protein
LKSITIANPGLAIWPDGKWKGSENHYKTHKKEYQNGNRDARKLISDAITAMPLATLGGGGGPGVMTLKFSLCAQLKTVKTLTKYRG